MDAWEYIRVAARPPPVETILRRRLRIYAREYIIEISVKNHDPRQTIDKFFMGGCVCPSSAERTLMKNTGPPDFHPY